MGARGGNEWLSSPQRSKGLAARSQGPACVTVADWPSAPACSPLDDSHQCPPCCNHLKQPASEAAAVRVHTSCGGPCDAHNAPHCRDSRDRSCHHHPVACLPGLAHNTPLHPPASWCTVWRMHTTLRPTATETIPPPASTTPPTRRRCVTASPPARLVRIPERHPRRRRGGPAGPGLCRLRRPLQAVQPAPAPHGVLFEQ